MRLAVIFSTALILYGCSQDSTQRSPTVPSSPSPPVGTAPQLVDLLGIVIPRLRTLQKGTIAAYLSECGQTVSPDPSGCSRSPEVHLD
jgi:hypothetical protein